MSGLDTLIRVHRWQLDEKRQRLGQLEQLQDRLRDEARRLIEELAGEQRSAAGSAEASFAYANYARALIERQRKLEASLAEVVEQITLAREQLGEAFREVKRYEIAAANRTKRERTKVSRRQQILQDELGLQMFRRGQPVEP